MPRDGANLYSKPAGTTAVSGTTIESAKYNSTIDDLVSDLNLPRPVVAGGTGASTLAGVLTAIGGQPLDGALTSLAGLTYVADRSVYSTAADTFALYTQTAFARTLMDDADAVTARATLGAVIGTNVQAWDADLDAVAGLSTTGLVARTGAGTVATRTITSTDASVTITNPGGVAGNINLAVTHLNLATAIATTSGTVHDFTGIPATANRVTISYAKVSLSGTSSHLVQVGSTTFTTTGYVSSSGSVSSVGTTATSSTSGFIILENVASREFSGAMTLTRLTGNTWSATHAGTAGGNETRFGGGSIVLAGVLGRVRVTSVTGADTFDLGTVNISWE